MECWKHTGRKGNSQHILLHHDLLTGKKVTLSASLQGQAPMSREIQPVSQRGIHLARGNSLYSTYMLKSEFIHHTPFLWFLRGKKVKRIVQLQVSKRILATQKSVLSEKGLTIREPKASLSACVCLRCLILLLVFCLPPSLLASFHHQSLLFLSFYLFLLNKFIIMNHTMLFQLGQNCIKRANTGFWG